MLPSPGRSLAEWQQDQPLFTGLGTEVIEPYLTLSIGKNSRRKLLDLKHRLLHRLYMPAYFSPSCPHCREPDSVTHRFVVCPEAQRARSELASNCPQAITLPLRDLLLAPAWLPEAVRAGAEAFTWYLHVSALHKEGVISFSPGRMAAMVAEFGPAP